jgi:TetR/AcrR family transcriptional repressor of nem operon
METVDKILNAAERLCQARGFDAMSFRDLAADVGVKSASIHYHFPTKADLARALTIRYRQQFETVRDEIDRREPTAIGRLGRLFDVIDSLYRDKSRICLAAVLAADASSVDAHVAEELKRFFEDNERWLAAVLTLGVTQGSMRRSADPNATARLVFAAIEGAILARRACDQPSRIRELGECLMQSLRT